MVMCGESTVVIDCDEMFAPACLLCPLQLRDKERNGSYLPEEGRELDDVEAVNPTDLDGTLAGVSPPLRSALKGGRGANGEGTSMRSVRLDGLASSANMSPLPNKGTQSWAARGGGSFNATKSFAAMMDGNDGAAASPASAGDKLAAKRELMARRKAGVKITGKQVGADGSPMKSMSGAAMKSMSADAMKSSAALRSIAQLPQGLKSMAAMRSSAAIRTAAAMRSSAVLQPNAAALRSSAALKSSAALRSSAAMASSPALRSMVARNMSMRSSATMNDDDEDDDDEEDEEEEDEETETVEDDDDDDDN